MIEIFHTPRFLFNSDEQPNILKVYHDIEIISKANELYSENGGGDFSFYLGKSYLCLDFDTESKRIGNFGGSINLSDVNYGSICFPKNILNGVLYVYEEKEFIHGGCWRFEFSETYLFDPDRSVLQIGTYNENKSCCKFLKNAYCQLSDQGNLNCLFISNIKLSI